MTRQTRRRFVAVLGTTTAVTLAGCSGSGEEEAGSQTTGDGGETATDSATETATSTGTDGSTDTPTDGDTTTSPGTETPTDTDVETTTSVTYDYTFADGDAVVGNPLSAVEISYPAGSGAFVDLSLGNILLGGASLAREIEDTATADDGDTYRIEFGGTDEIEAGDKLTIDISNVYAPSGSYDVTVVVNPDAGATTFTESF